jgi:hypothetical protein
VLELNGLPARPRALRVDTGGPVANGYHAISGVRRIIPGNNQDLQGSWPIELHTSLGSIT